MKFLIDADIVAFKASASTERPIDWGDGMWTLHAFEHEGIEYIHSYLHKIVNTLGDGEFSLFLTDPENWRKEVLPSYKSNRKGQRKPLTLQPLRQYMLDNMRAVMVPSMEADDLLGITATNETDCVIVSEDKDLATIPCQLFNPAKDEAVRTISEFDADYLHMKQTLTGDPVDGYAGLAGCGDKTAEKILDGCETVKEMWAAVVQAYSKKKLSEEVALTQARVARICRASDFDFNTGKVILWKPPT
jgi:DNA polymerase-1